METSWEPVANTNRMVPPPGRLPEPDIPQGQQRGPPPPRGTTQQRPPAPAGPGGGVRYANDCEIIVTAKAQQYVNYYTVVNPSLAY